MSALNLLEPGVTKRVPRPERVYGWIANADIVVPEVLLAGPGAH
jgi:hypothetical protein